MLRSGGLGLWSMFAAIVELLRIRDLPYEREWNGKLHSIKQLRSTFLEEAHKTVVVTVCSYWFPMAPSDEDYL